MIGIKLINSFNYRKLRKLSKLIIRTGSVYLSGESLGIPRTSLQDLLSTARDLLEIGSYNSRDQKRCIRIYNVISVSHARWAINTLESIQYGGLASARRSNAVLYLLQTFKPLDFPKTSYISTSENALSLIATLRAIGSSNNQDNLSLQSGGPVEDKDSE